jgi:uncharacterized protein
MGKHIRKTMKDLRIANNFLLPAEAATQTFAILAKRGVGKTYTAAVLTEEFLKAQLPVVVCDPVGVWWGLRAAANGKSTGLPIVVLGGDHGDLPLEETAGEVLASLIAEERLSVVLDLSHFRKAQQTRFMSSFCETLYHRNRHPLHLMVDEADAFAPQRPMKGEERLLGAMEDIVRRGRARGLGTTLITQRAAVINKNVLTQIEVLICLRTIAPQDREAIDAWVQVHGTPEQRKQLLASLPSLPVGTAWFWSPGWLNVFQQVKVRKRETFDSSATPKIGAMSARLQSPKNLASVDLDKLRRLMAETIDNTKANDPRVLRRQIAHLQQQLQLQTKPVIERIEIPVLHDHQIAEVKEVVQQLHSLGQGLQSLAQELQKGIERVVKLQALPMEQYLPSQKTIPVNNIKGSGLTGSELKDGKTNSRNMKLSGGERKILSVLAQYPKGRTKSQVAIITGYSHKGGAFNNYLSALRTRGLIEKHGELLIITEIGLQTGIYEVLPTGSELIQYWKNQLGKAERAILDVLVDRYPNQLSKEEIANHAGYEASGGGFNNAMSKLRTLELIQGHKHLKASDALFTT